jgi:hypothetical protein
MPPPAGRPYQYPDLVIEIGPQAGWVHDIAVRLGISVEIANSNHEGWLS